MTPDDGQYTVALILWTILLGIVVFVLVPATLYRARRLVKAVRSVESNLTVTLRAATAVVANTTPARAMLGQTMGAAGEVVAVAGKIEAHTGAIEGVLAARAGARP